MANEFLNIPGWFSWENQGMGAAVTDLEGTGQQDVIFLMVDHPQGGNQGMYKVGKCIEPNGEVTEGWSDWIAIPDWESWENEGAGLAITDLDGDQRPDMIVFRIDNPGAQNQGYYRVGKKLDANGLVTGGWGGWMPIPDWFSWDNQYGGIAVADLDGNGRPELIVFMIDSPLEQNQGYLRIGRNLDENGIVTGGWTAWTPVPGWFPWENQGGGVAAADLEDSGLIDLIVFMVDNAAGQNQAFYKVGKNLTIDGEIEGGWGSWMGVPGWTAWENEGGAITTMKKENHYELLVAMVDNPPEGNAGLYQILDLVDDPQTRGSWELLPYYSEVLAVHAAVLPTGKALFYAGAGSSLVRFLSPDFGNMEKGYWTSVVWDPATPPAPNTNSNYFHPDTMRDANGHAYDFFCGGDAFLPDGRLLQAGGSLDYPRDGHYFLGLKQAFTFDPQTEQWIKVPDMPHGRWYPTLVTLADGRVLAVSGLDEFGNLNIGLDVYDGKTNTWQQLHVLPQNEFMGLPLYAHLFQMQDGQIFYTGGRMDDPSPLGPVLLDLTKDPVAVTPVGGLTDPASRNQSASVILPPAQDQKVLIIGGGPEMMMDATDSVDLIDFNDPQPAFHPVSPMNLPRMHLNAVLLPDHTVFVSGGALKREFLMAARLQSELYDPATDTWRIMATAVVPRLYHSIALLLPDGRVIAAGGNPEGGHQVPWLPPDPNEELRMEVYSPPYLFRGLRPVIDSAPAVWKYGQTAVIQTQQAGNIRWASLIHPGVTTHSFNNAQRLVDLDILSQGNGEIQAALMNNPNIATPGWYMLFIIDQEGIPSVANWVQVGA